MTIRERERIEMFQVAEFARRRLNRGSRISAPEAIAIVCDELLEMAWDGIHFEEVIASAYSVLKPEQLMPGVPNTVPQIQVEALFPQGTALLSVDWPFGRPEEDGPGGLCVTTGDIEINPGRPILTLSVGNKSDRPVFVSSHFPFADVNSDLEFDRQAAQDKRLNIAAGSSEAFAPGTTRDVELISINRVGTDTEER